MGPAPPLPLAPRRPDSRGIVLFIWEDPTSWRPLLAAMPRRTRSAAFIEATLREEYEGVVVYHACRPESPEPYYRDGLKLLDREHAYARARGIFLSGEFPELTVEAFDDACSQISDIDDNRAFACLDQRDLLEGAGHYLIYGSEVICGIAGWLGRRNPLRDYRQVLKRYGRPTLFRIRLPFHMVSGPLATEFAKAVREELPWVRRGNAPRLIDFTFRLRQAVPGTHFIDHSHPQQIVDPLLRMTTYRTPAGVAS